MTRRRRIAPLLILVLHLGCEADDQLPVGKPPTTQALPNESVAEVEVNVVGVYRKPDREFVHETLKPLLVAKSSPWSSNASGNSVIFRASAAVDLTEVAKQLPFGKVMSIEDRRIRVVYLEKDYKPFLPRHKSTPGSFDAPPPDPLGPALDENNGDWKAALRDIGANFRLNDRGQVVELKMPFFKTSDESLKHVASLTALRKLNLSMCKVSDEGARHLIHLTELENLNLFGTNIGNLGHAHLATLRQLKILRLANNGNEEGLRHLKDLNMVEELKIGYGLGYPVTASGIKYLQGMSNLASLRLDGCEIPDEALEMIGMFGKLNLLHLEDGTMTDAAVEHLSGLVHLRSLSLKDCDQVGDAGVAHLQPLAGLTYLNLAGTQVSDKGVVHLARLKQLSSWSLAATQVTDRGVKSLGSLQRLRQLILDDTVITDTAIEHLNPFPKLDNVWLSKTRITDAALKHLGTISQLRTLYLNGTDITDVGMGHLAALTELRSLGISETAVTEQGLQHLKNCTQLTDIRAEDSGVTPEAIRRFLNR